MSHQVLHWCLLVSSVNVSQLSSDVRIHSNCGVAISKTAAVASEFPDSGRTHCFCHPHLHVYSYLWVCFAVLLLSFSGDA